MSRLFFFLLFFAFIIWGFFPLVILGSIFLILYKYNNYFEIIFFGALYDLLTWGSFTLHGISIPLYTLVAGVVFVVFSFFLKKYIK